jgi:gliding motility-associated-like protein
LWNFGDGTNSVAQNPVHTYVSAGVYSVKLTCYGKDPCGPDTLSLAKANYIHVINNAVESAFSADSIPGCSPLHVNFSDKSTNANAWLWNFGDGNGSQLQNPAHDFYSGTWNVQLIAFNNNPPCPASDSIKKLSYIVTDTCFYNLLIPNVFSPDGDGKNDLFKITADGYTDYKMEIYDRWGTQVFYSTDVSISWNGKLHNTGAELTAGTYYYIFSVKDRKNTSIPYKGFLTLMRN